MRRGELWTVSGGPGFAGKPRPALIVQDDAYRQTHSVVICPLTSDETLAEIPRQPIDPGGDNGLTRSSRVMIDKVTTIPRARLGKRIGALSSEDMARVDRALIVFLGLAG